MSEQHFDPEPNILRTTGRSAMKSNVYVNGLQMMTCNDLADMLLFNLSQVSGLNSLLTNTLVRVELCQEVEAVHPLIMFWLFMLPKGRFLLLVVTF